MAPKKKTVDKIPAGTGDATDSGSTSNVIGGNDPTLDPGKDPSQTASAVSEMNIIRLTTWSTHINNPLTKTTRRDEYPPPGKSSDDPEPSEQSDSADPDPEELVLGDQIQEMLDTIKEHMDEVKSIHNMSCQAAQLLEKKNESNNALEARTRTLRTQLITIREIYLTIAKGKSGIHPRDPTRDPNNEEIDPHSERPINWSNNYIDEELMNGQPNIDPELTQSTAQSNNRSGTKHALDHLNQAAMTARSTRSTSIDPPSENAREEEIRDNPHKSVRYAPFDSIEDKDTDSETTVRNSWEGSVPFQHLDERNILDMSNNESNNALIRMVKYMLDQNNHTTMEKSPLAKAGVKVTPPDKYSGEQSFEALETFIKGLLQWLDMHSMLGPDAYKYQVSFLGYQGIPMNLEQVVTGLYGQYIPSLARCKVSNKFDLIKQGTLSVQEFATEPQLYTSRMVQQPDTYSLRKKFIDNLQPGLLSLLLHAGLKSRNNGPYRTKSRTDLSKLGEINKGPSITPGSSGVNRNSSTAPGGAGPPIHNRQWTNHESSYNSIECYNCGKSGHIKPNCPEPISACCVGAVHVEDSPAGQVNNADLDINDTIDDEHPNEDDNKDYDNQLELSKDQRS
ncbi:hypothetical protein M422DRAFT_258938 [Sphaerobolus stellatus SS14]|uniref:CCHC-type domain-containing protein n=1 Tax=Sphaerobolus stellatus (strain SS14) TaxID=990650 RepID=A0A0C9VL62_SPHS4|nr:hypothetical protein M422DRAFT_258938 [Sphaerobolus stellatus SS14]